MTIYLTDMGAFSSVNEVYGSFFESNPPARVAVGVAALPRGAQVEMDAVVALTLGRTSGTELSVDQVASAISSRTSGGLRPRERASSARHRCSARER